MTDVAAVFEENKGVFTPEELAKKMKWLRGQVFGILPAETTVRDLYVLARRHGWLSPDSERPGFYKIEVRAGRPSGAAKI